MMPTPVAGNVKDVAPAHGVSACAHEQANGRETLGRPTTSARLVGSPPEHVRAASQPPFLFVSSTARTASIPIKRWLATSVISDESISIITYAGSLPKYTSNTVHEKQNLLPMNSRNSPVCLLHRSGDICELICGVLHEECPACVLGLFMYDCKKK
jgi:hypothetical protein